jgi:hypothetical protein
MSIEQNVWIGERQERAKPHALPVSECAEFRNIATNLEFLVI